MSDATFDPSGENIGKRMERSSSSDMTVLVPYARVDGAEQPQTRRSHAPYPRANHFTGRGAPTRTGPWSLLLPGQTGDTAVLEQCFDRIKAFVAPHRKRLLVVEDNATESESIIELLGHDDLEITAVSTGKKRCRHCSIGHLTVVFSICGCPT